jgi:hypothetical protein
LENRKRITGEAPVPRRKSKKKEGPGPGKVGIVVGGRIKYVDRPGYVAPAAPEPAAPAPKERKAKRPAEKIDPKYLAAARELRDRYLERFNSGLVLPQGKYAVGRLIDQTMPQSKPIALLPQAA